MALLVRKCAEKACNKEVLVVVSEKSTKDKIYFWKCPWCEHENALQVVHAK